MTVWPALLHADHVHRGRARLWWQRANGPIAFTRFTQISLLRLLTTSAAQGSVITFDQALAARGARYLLAEPGENA